MIAHKMKTETDDSQLKVKERPLDLSSFLY